MWFLNLIRWKNLLIILLMQGLIFSFFCQEDYQFFSLTSDDYISLWLICLGTLAITAAGNIVNDIYDRKIDAVNKPGRNAVNYKLSLSKAWLIAVVLNVAGIVIGLLVDGRLAVVNLVVVFLLWLYSYKLKCTPLLGNLVVAVLMGLSVWVVDYAADFCSPLPFYLYVMFAIFTGLVREMVKDLEDVEGDSAAGCKTLPVLAGISFSKNLAAATQFFGTLIIAAGCYYLVREQPLWHMIYFSAAVILPMLVLFVMIVTAKQKAHYSRISAGLKIIMVTGLFYLPLAHYIS
jgi:4-hydroxybenzoate polyprenyltransferase